MEYFNELLNFLRLMENLGTKERHQGVRGEKKNMEKKKYRKKRIKEVSCINWLLVTMLI